MHFFFQVNVTRREQELKLEGLDFDERKKTNRRKRLIAEGKDPDAEEKERERARQKRIRGAIQYPLKNITKSVTKPLKKVST